MRPSIRFIEAFRGDDSCFVWSFLVSVPADDAKRYSLGASYMLMSLDSGIHPRGWRVRDGWCESVVTVTAPDSIRYLSVVLRDVSSASAAKTVATRTVDRHAMQYHKDHYFKAIRNAVADETYPAWFQARRATDEQLERQRQADATGWPLISIITPVYNTRPAFLRAMLDSVQAQSYANWESILVNGSPGNLEVTAIIDEYAAHDSRFRIVPLEENGGIALNTNTGIAESRGAYVGFLDHDDTLEPDALFEYASAIMENPDAGLLYCDEDCIDESGGGDNFAILKPWINLDLLYSNNYVIHFLMVSRSVLDRTTRSGKRYDGAQDYDLTLKAFELTRDIVHIPRILYHWRQHSESMSINPKGKPYAQEAGRLAIADHLERLGVACDVGFGEEISSYHVKYLLPPQAPRVSIIMPVLGRTKCLLMSRGAPLASLPLVSATLEALLAKTDYSNFEIILPYSQDVEEEVLGLPLYEDRHIGIVPVKSEGNAWVDMANEGRMHASGDLLVFASDDLAPSSADWLSTMAGYFSRGEVAAVAPRIIQRDGMLVCTGLTVRPDGSLGYLNHDLPIWDGGYLWGAHRTRDIRAASASCLMVRAGAFDAVGGFCADFATEPEPDYAAADLCMALVGQGSLVVFSPYAELSHMRPVFPNEQAKLGPALMKRRWRGAIGEYDPSIDPNFDPYRDYFILRK